LGVQSRAKGAYGENVAGESRNLGEVEGICLTDHVKGDASGRVIRSNED